MGTTIRRSVGDTDPLIYELKDKLIYEDRSWPVNLLGKKVYLTMVNSYLEIPDVPLKYVFGSDADRDQYFIAYPDELVDGLITVVNVNNVVTCKIWRGSQWNADYWTIVQDKECTVTNASKGYISYAFTTEEACRSGMFHVYFKVVAYLYTVDSDYVFSDLSACNSYFADPEHSAELVDGIIVSINNVYYGYNGSAWIEGDAVSTSIAKYPRGDSLWIHLMDIFTE